MIDVVSRAASESRIGVQRTGHLSIFSGCLSCCHVLLHMGVPTLHVLFHHQAASMVQPRGYQTGPCRLSGCRYFLELIQNQKSDLLEWIIIILIGGEISLSLYELFLK